MFNPFWSGTNILGTGFSWKMQRRARGYSLSSDRMYRRSNLLVELLCVAEIHKERGPLLEGMENLSVDWESFEFEDIVRVSWN